MIDKPSSKQRWKIILLKKIIGAQALPYISDSDYSVVNGYHVYVDRLKNDDISLRIWTEQEDHPGARCKFSHSFSREELEFIKARRESIAHW